MFCAMRQLPVCDMREKGELEEGIKEGEEWRKGGGRNEGRERGRNEGREE